MRRALVNWLAVNRVAIAVHAGAALTAIAIAYSTVYGYAMTATIVRHFLDLPVQRQIPPPTGVVSVSILPAGTKPGQPAMVAPPPAPQPEAPPKPKGR